MPVPTRLTPAQGQVIRLKKLNTGKMSEILQICLPESLFSCTQEGGREGRPVESLQESLDAENVSRMGMFPECHLVAKGREQSTEAQRGQPPRWEGSQSCAAQMCINRRETANNEPSQYSGSQPP